MSQSTKPHTKSSSICVQLRGPFHKKEIKETIICIILYIKIIFSAKKFKSVQGHLKLQITDARVNLCTLNWQMNYISIKQSHRKNQINILLSCILPNFNLIALYSSHISFSVAHFMFLLVFNMQITSY